MRNVCYSETSFVTPVRYGHKRVKFLLPPLLLSEEQEVKNTSSLINYGSLS